MTDREDVSGPYDDQASRTRRREAVRAALERFPTVAEKFRAAYGMRLPRHLAWAAAFFLGLSPRERALCPVSLFGFADWFHWLTPDQPERVPILDERLEGRFRRDPPEFVSVASGDSDGSHWGLFYDLPDELPRFVAHGWARDDGAVWQHQPTLLASIRRELRGGHLDPDDKRRLRAVVGWLDALHEREREAHAAESIGAPFAERVDGGTTGLGPYLPGFTPPAELGDAGARWELYQRGGGELDAWVARARQEPALALLLGRELHFRDHDDTREVGHELLVFGYESLGRRQLADAARVHHAHRDLRSVGIYRNKGEESAPPELQTPYVPPPLLTAVRARDRAQIEAALAGGATPEDIAAACREFDPQYGDPERDTPLLELLLARGGAEAASGALGMQLLRASACVAPDLLAKASHAANKRAREMAEHSLARKSRRLIDALFAHGARPAFERDGEHAVCTGDPDLAARVLRAAPAGFDPAGYRTHYFLFEDPERPPGGATLLHLAACTGSPDVVRLVLDLGLSPETKDDAGQSARDLARALWTLRPREANEMLAMFDGESAKGTDAVPAPPPAAPAGFRVGGAVRHAKFGEGTVLAIAGAGDEAKLTVRFAEAGEKTLLARFLTAP